MRLHDYWRSSAAYRVRIALNLKGLAYQQISIDLRAGAQRSSAYRSRNPQGLVPYLQDGDVGLGQSFAIMEYLEERYPEPPLLPRAPAARADVRALALLIVCEIHPLNNMRVLQYLERQSGVAEPDRLAWYRHWIGQGFEPIEAVLADRGDPFCFGDTPTMADLCLVPQVYNARRYTCDLEPYPTIRAIDQRCRQIDAFAGAAPELQPDAVSA
jgi:maleylacetoacetate isomerase